MSSRFDVCVPRKRKGKDGEDKTFWVRVGAAFQNEKGTQIVLDALPLPDADGRCVLMLFEPKERLDGGGGDRPAGSSGGKPAGGGRGSFDDMDDNIPF
ncbi:MAG: hypothetical protein ACK53W_03510 [Gemmatimonadota bacterium]|jgi:hypothetical protein